jgi:hypothetical protein
MSETEIQAVDTPAPDANAAPIEESATAPSPVVNDTDEIAAKARGVGKRIDELTRNWREAERREAALLKILEREQPRETPKPQEDTSPRTLADFGYDEGKFQSYIFGQAEKRSREAARAELKESQEREAKERRQTSFASKASEFAKTVEDYDSVVTNPRLAITPEMAEAIRESDDGPALAYHLGKNPEIAEKLAQLPPFAAARELGKIEARLANEREKAKEKPVSKAPPPPPKVEGADPATSVKPDDPNSDSLSDDEWVRRRNKQLASRRRS